MDCFSCTSIHTDLIIRNRWGTDNNQSQPKTASPKCIYCEIISFFCFHVQQYNVDEGCLASSNENHPELEGGSQPVVSEVFQEERNSNASRVELFDNLQQARVDQEPQSREELGNSFRFAVECRDLESLERLWSHYGSGYLNSMAENFF